MDRLGTRLTVARFIILVALGASALAQQGAPQFEVISVKPKAENLLPLFPACRGDRFAERGLPILYLMRWAYELSATRIQGLPAWANDRDGIYDIEARASAAVSAAQCRVMFQSLLASRFRMATHREQKEMRAYALTVGRKGPKMREVTPGGKSTVTMNGEPFWVGGQAEPPNGLSMERFASFLSSVPAIGLPVIDRTGLGGTYSFNLTFTVREGDDLPSIWLAVQEQLGLKLELTKALIEVLVVDHIEKPGSN